MAVTAPYCFWLRGSIFLGIAFLSAEVYQSRHKDAYAGFVLSRSAWSTRGSAWGQAAFEMESGCQIRFTGGERHRGNRRACSILGRLQKLASWLFKGQTSPSNSSL